MTRMSFLNDLKIYMVFKIIKGRLIVEACFQNVLLMYLDKKYFNWFQKLNNSEKKQ